MKITEQDRRRMNNKLIQFWRFVILNLKILRAVDHSKRAWCSSSRPRRGAQPRLGEPITSRLPRPSRPSTRGMRATSAWRRSAERRTPSSRPSRRRASCAGGGGRAQAGAPGGGRPTGGDWGAGLTL